MPCKYGLTGEVRMTEAAAMALAATIVEGRVFKYWFSRHHRNGGDYLFYEKNEPPCGESWNEPFLSFSGCGDDQFPAEALAKAIARFKDRPGVDLIYFKDGPDSWCDGVYYVKPGQWAYAEMVAPPAPGDDNQKWRAAS